MKFTDGHWLMRPGVKAAYPAQAYETDHDDTTLTIVAPCRTISHRGDTLQGPVLTVRLSAPMPDVIRVQVVHEEPAAPPVPQFATKIDAAFRPRIATDETQTVFESGRLAVTIPADKGWQLAFTGDGQPLTLSGARGIGHMELDGAAYTYGQTSLAVGESVYGLGERFTAFVKNGQVVETVNKDPGTGTDQAYKSIPFFLTNKGYGVFVNDPGEVSFEVASETVSRVQFSAPGEALDYFLIYGPSPKKILEKYTALTGRPALPPAWTFGLWLTTSFTTSYDEATVTSFIDGMAQRDLPLHVFHFDCFWMREFRWCDFEWDTRVFPDPPAMLRRLKDRGLKICVWINPYIAQLSPLFAEGRAAGYLIKRPDGTVWQTDQWQPGMGIVDFTNPDACAWYAGKLAALLDMGVDCFKTDFGERIPTDVAYHDGSDPVKMHNYFALLYNKTVFDLLIEKRGVGEAAVFARSATAGGQMYPVHWGGDCESTFESMAESLRGGLSLCLSGFGFWSHDIGGFEGTPPVALYKRWVAFGLLSSHSRLHGSSSYRVPWQYDEEAVDVLRLFTKLKCRLMPYLYAHAVEAHQFGVPLMRAMLLEFPEDPTCAYLDRQYLLGESLLVAPVFSEDGTVEYYLPDGVWTDFLTGRELTGPRWVRETHDFMSLPLLVRPNSVIAVGAHDARPDYEFADGVTFHVYSLIDGCSIATTVPALDGSPSMSALVERSGGEIAVRVTNATKPWSALLCGIADVAQTHGGQATQDARGLLLTPEAGADTLRVVLRD